MTKNNDTERHRQLTALSVDKLISEYAIIAFSNIDDLIQMEGDCYTFKNGLDREKLRSIQSIEVKQSAQGPEIKIKLHDKLAALKFLSRYLGLDKDCKDFDYLNRVILSLNPGQLNQLIASLEKNLTK